MPSFLMKRSFMVLAKLPPTVNRRTDIDTHAANLSLTYILVVLLQYRFRHVQSVGTLQACGYIQSVYCCMLTPYVEC